MAQYIDSLLSALVGIYVVLLGLGVNLPPQQYRGKKLALLLGSLIIAGSGASFLSSATYQKSTANSIVQGIKQKVHLPVQVDDITILEDVVAEKDAIVYVVKIQKG